MTVGERIKERRRNLGLSVDEIAAKLDKDRATIYRYENNYIKDMPLNTLEPIAEVLHTTPAYLMGWADGPEPKEEQPAVEDELSKEEVEYIKLFRAASPELQVAALAMLEAAEKARLARDSSAKDG